MWSCKMMTIFLFVPYFVAPDESIVYNYSSENFKKEIEQMDGNFIMFYAPWCRHCTEFYPIWEELAELVNTEESRFAIAQVDCMQQSKLCNDNDITGYPTLQYYHKNSFQPVEYKGTRDLPSLTLFLSEAFTLQDEKADRDKKEDAVRVYSGMAYLNDHNVEKYLSTGQHFVMFYASWCRASQLNKRSEYHAAWEQGPATGIHRMRRWHNANQSYYSLLVYSLLVNITVSLGFVNKLH